MANPGLNAVPRRTNFERLGAVLEHPWFLPAAALLGLFCRLLLLYVTSRHPAVFQDELEYQAIAVSLWKTHTYAMFGAETAFRPPAEPLLIAAVFAVLGYAPAALRLLQAILFTAEPFLCAALGRRLGLSVRAANAAALLASLHPGLAYSTTTLYPTALTTLALTAGLLWSVRAAESDGKTASAGAGLALGLAGLSTTTFVPLPLLVACYCVWKKKLRAAVIIGILGMTPALIWLVRNHSIFGQYTIATNGGMNLALGANDESTPRSGNWVSLGVWDPGITFGDEIGQDHMYQGRAKVWIRMHPVRYAWLCVRRALVVVDSVGRPKTPGLHSGVGEKVIGWAMLPVVLMGLAGLFFYRRTDLACLTFAALMLVVVSSAFTIVKPRFRFPCDPTLGVFAAAAVPRVRRMMEREPRVRERVEV